MEAHTEIIHTTTAVHVHTIMESGEFSSTIVGLLYYSGRDWYPNESQTTPSTVLTCCSSNEGIILYCSEEVYSGPTPA